MKLFTICLVAFVAAASVTATQAQTEVCKELRLDTPDGPLYSVPVANQSSLDICQFIAAADLIEAHRYYATDLAPI